MVEISCAKCNGLVSVVVFVVTIFVATLKHVAGHGGLLEPPSRSLAWRYGFDAPINYDWMSLFCGGYQKFQQSGGKCGACGDPYDGPFEQDRGGVYDTGIIVRHYPVGHREIEVKTEITAHHKGYITFKLCPNNEKPLTNECLDRHPLKIREARLQGDPYKFYPPENPKLHELHVELPRGMICDRCVLQWKYTAGNSVGRAKNGTTCLGCGLQETFVNCADISIGGTVDRIHVSKDMFPPSNGEEIVLSQVPDLATIIDRAPQDSISDVLSAIGTRTREPGSPKGRPQTPKTPTIMVLTRRRNGNGDLPGFTREQIDHANTNSLQIDTSRGSRSKGRLVGIDIFGNRLAISNGNEFSSSNMLTMPAAIPRDEILRLREKQARIRANGMLPVPAERSANTGFEIPPPSIVSGDFPHRFTPVPNIPVITAPASNHGGSSLIGSVTNVVKQLQQTGQRVTLIPRPRSNRRNTRKPLVTVVNRNDFGNSQRLPPTVQTVHHPTQQPGTHTQPSPQFVSQMNELRRAFPNQADWVRGDGMSSHRSAVRQNSQLDTHDFSTSEIRQHVPDLPTNLGPRQDMNIALERRDPGGSIHSNWFPNSHSTVNDSRMRMHEQAMAKTEPRDRSSNLPRRIVVHSMAVAQHLLRKWPQLRGRVFLSREAHVRNKYANVVNRYSSRQRWQR